MKQLAGLTIASLCTIALGGIATAESPEARAHPAGRNPTALIVIEKELPDDHGGVLPPAWAFRIDSVNCGDAISTLDRQRFVETLVVEVDGEGGLSEPIPVDAFDGPCRFRIIEVPVDGWEPVSPESGATEIAVEDDDVARVVFSNRPVPPPEVTTTTVADTTTTVAATTTTVAATTTTVAETTTTAAPTSAPPTTAGTVAPELPATGTSNALTGLLAGLLVLGGLGAVLAGRRT